MGISSQIKKNAQGLRNFLGARLSLYGDPGLPEQLHICPTDRCNLQCRQCDIWRIKPAPELSTDEWKMIIDEVAEFAGAIALNFAGGEPFLRPDLLELIRHASAQGFTVTSNSNGTLITEKLAQGLFESGLDILYISLDGFTSQTHDHIRNKEGLYERVLKNLDYIDALPAPRIVIATILHKRSIHEIDAALDLIKTRDYQLVVQPLYQTFGEPYDAHWYKRSTLYPDDLLAVDAALDRLIQARREAGPVCNPVAQLEEMKRYYRAPTLPNGHSCKAGFKDISLDPYGNFHLCYHLKPLGNIRDEGVKGLWQSQKSAILRQEIASCPRTCNLLNCNFEGSD